MSNWIKTDTLQSGDIIQLPGKILGIPIIIKHFGVVVKVDGKTQVVHNPGSVSQIDPIEKVLEGRQIEKVIRTGLSDSVILERFEQCKNTRYSFAYYNCQDYIVSITGVSPSFDQRIFWGSILLVIVLIALFLILRKL